MHDKERKVVEHFFLLDSSFFQTGMWSFAENRMTILCFIIYTFIQRLRRPWIWAETEELIISPIDNMYWRSPNIYLKLNWTQFDNAVPLSFFVLFVHFNILNSYPFSLSKIQITHWLNTDWLHSLWRSPHTKTKRCEITHSRRVLSI